MDWSERSGSGYLGAWAGALVGLLAPLIAFPLLALLLGMVVDPGDPKTVAVLALLVFGPLALLVTQVTVILGCHLGVRRAGHAAGRTTAYLALLLLGAEFLAVVVRSVLGDVLKVGQYDPVAIASYVVAVLAFMALPLAARWLALRVGDDGTDPVGPDPVLPQAPSGRDDASTRYWNT